MRSLLLIILFTLTVVSFNAQENLITNPGFEDKKYCPTNFNQQQLTQVQSWWQVGRGTPDYFHECSTKAGVPSNLFGNLEAQEGLAYAGLVSYSGTSKNYREYLQTKLSRPLSSGEKICVEYYVSTADKSLFVTDGIGFLFSEKKIKGSKDKVILARPQIKNLNLNLLDGYGTWIKISDVFVAEGGEEYLTIGNFESDVMTTVLKRNGEGNEINKWAYVYIDDITIRPVKSREECSCVNDIIATTIHDPPLELSEVRKIEIRSVLFDFDQSLINEEAQTELDDVVKLLYRNKSFFLRVIGHTDIVGSEEYNLGLSEDRAAAVINYLQDKGVDKQRLELEYKGSRVPVAPNDTSEGRQQNRRVEFEILEYKYERIISEDTSK